MVARNKYMHELLRGTVVPPQQQVLFVHILTNREKCLNCLEQHKQFEANGKNYERKPPVVGYKPTCAHGANMVAHNWQNRSNSIRLKAQSNYSGIPSLFNCSTQAFTRSSVMSSSLSWSSGSPRNLPSRALLDSVCW